MQKSHLPNIRHHSDPFDALIDVDARLAEALGPLRLRGVKATARNGKVTIIGEVHSFYQRQLCIRTCQQIAGTRTIDDQLKVNGSTRVS